MRKISILFIVTLFSFTQVKSQSIFPISAPFYPGINFLNNSQTHDSLSKSKWFLTSYSGLSTSVSFFNGGNATIMALSMGVQLNRRLNNNLYAFANASVVPAFISLTPSLKNTGINKNYMANPFMSNGFNAYPSVSLGLMYVNDARTFSISGSISAERGSYPLIPYYQGNKAPVMTHSER